MKVSVETESMGTRHALYDDDLLSNTDESFVVKETYVKTRRDYIKNELGERI